MEKPVAKTNSEKLHDVLEELPEFTNNFFYFGSANRSVITKLNYALDIRYFLEYSVNFFSYFPDKSVKELSLDDLKMITALDIDNYVSWMAENRHLKDKTLARRRSSISVLFEYLINTERKLEYNPVSGSTSIKIDLPETVTYLTLDEQNVLLDCIKNGTGLTRKQQIYHEKYKDRDLAIVFLFLDTGLRISELQALDVDDVVIFENPYHPENNECYVNALRKGHKKSNNTSKVYFSDESKDYIREYLNIRELKGEKFKEGTPLFVTLEGTRLSIREIQQMLKKYVKASLNRSDISVHKLRSSFAMEFYKHEKNILVLQQRMGHKSMAATNIYARASDREEAVKESRNWRNK
jgi:site-specific recombinase XerD